ncbi:hypothetical protein NLJ89_g6531 [Agrocybe chaxingu]|uniref:Uncharacterized protein n=1 Tax=Agrocybe chaxingu TaxID=84603 RepID=A0A9W8MWB5_9AGAR|nr:hypothetical protein NLJ89_g6531 [Agrocybe chaxingu]
MPSTPRKRPASRSPDGARSSKRQLTSSPEEGEVDDTLPTPGPNPNPIIPAISLPAKPATLIKKSVPFPFKRKPDGPKSSADGEKSEPLNVFAQYEEAHRPREEPRRANNRPLPRSGKTDHWEPGFGRGESLLSRIEPLESYRRHELGSSRDSWDRERRRSPTTRNSPPRSRSPPSHYRGKHRLPAPRSPEASFSPPTQPTLDRLRDRSRERGYDRERDRDREWDRDRYRRDFREDDSRRFGRRNSLTDDSDGRYYRPQYNDHRRGDDREWTRRDPAPYRGREDDRYDRRSYDSRPPSRPRSPPSSGLISPPLAPPTQPEFHRPVSPPPQTSPTPT